MNLILSNLNYYIQDPYNQGFLSNKSVMTRAPKLQFSKSLFDTDQLAGVSIGPCWAEPRFTDYTPAQ